MRKLATKPASKGKHVVPFCCFRPWQMGRQFLIKAKAGTLQYVVLKCSLQRPPFPPHLHRALASFTPRPSLPSPLQV